MTSSAIISGNLRLDAQYRTGPTLAISDRCSECVRLISVSNLYFLCV